MEDGAKRAQEKSALHSTSALAAARHLRRRVPQEREDAQLLRECRTRLVYMHGTVRDEQCTHACGEREDVAVQIFCYSYHFYYGTILTVRISASSFWFSCRCVSVASCWRASTSRSELHL